MGERIAKASKVPFVISFICLGRDTVCDLCGCFVWHTGGHINQGNASIKKFLIAIRPQYILCVPPYVGLYLVNC